MFSTYIGPTADSVWQKMADDFRESRNVNSQVSRCGDTDEILHAAISVEDPRQRWVTSRRPPLNIAFALAEVVWIMAGRRDLKFLHYWNRRLDKYVGPGPNLHGAYGDRLRHYRGLDQMRRAYEVLLHDPNSRQVVLQIWDSSIDLPEPNGTPGDSDIPCNVGAMLKIRAGKLEWTQIIRSNDLFLGVPYNFVQFTFLQEIMAGWLDVDCGSYTQFSDSLHIYHRDMEKVVSSSGDSGIVRSTDSLALSIEDSILIFRELERRIEDMINMAKGLAEVYALQNYNGVPVAYQNILVVLVAEALRRRGENDAAQEVISKCSNPVYRYLWRQWFSRVSGRTLS